MSAMTVPEGYRLVGGSTEGRSLLQQESDSTLFSARAIPIVGCAISDISTETRLLQSLHHPNIVELATCPGQLCVDNGRLAIFEAYYEGRLADFYGRIDHRRAMQGLVAAVHYLHSGKRLVHLRIGPSNVFVGRDGAVRVGGVSRMLNNLDYEVNETASRYQAP